MKRESCEEIFSFYEEKIMGFKTTPMNFLENIPENRMLKEELLKKYEINENDIEHPCWDLMMTEYVSQIYCLVQI
jgi:hypothetical protein